MDAAPQPGMDWTMSRSLNIVLDARATTPHFPGVARATMGLLGGLAAIEHPHRIHVLAADGAPPASLAAFADARLRRVVTGLAPLDAGQQWRLPALATRLRAELWHAPYYVRPFWGLPPTVVSVYDIIGRVVPGALPLGARFAFEALMRLSLRSAALVIASSEATRDDLAAVYRVPRARLRVIPLAAGTMFRPQPAAVVAAARDRYGLAGRYLLYVGSNKPHKNVPALVQAFARVDSDAMLVIAGRWDLRYPEARYVARRLGLGERVRWLPDLDDTALPALICGALGFVFPSRYEGFGFPPLEAMQCGTPVIAAATSSLPEVVGDAGLLVAPTVAGLAAAMSSLVDDGRLRERLAEAGIQRAARFSWAETARRTVQVYQEL